MLQVRETEDQRGRGAFAAQPISAGTFLGWYEGEILDEQQYWQRYPSGVVSEQGSPLHMQYQLQLVFQLMPGIQAERDAAALVPGNATQLHTV